jgi:rhamnose utilization protein RhaD (predicted bifunctional aldolase and dehydrogenase)
MAPAEIRADLVDASREVALPEHEWVILGEGNTSARLGDNRMLVKASGVSLCGIDADGFVEVRIDAALAILDLPNPDDAAIRDALRAARVDDTSDRMPSVETVMHALCVSLGDASFVAHTHPVSVNSILCSQASREAFSGRLFPDEIVVCGRRPIFVPYIDPGVPLGRTIRTELKRYIQEEEDRPRVILLENHGMLALGRDAREVVSVTSMMDKTAKILAATYALGGPRRMTPEAAERIRTRPDEHYRQKLLGLREDVPSPEECS